MLNTDHWLHQYPSLSISGQLKAVAEDFQVTEILGYEPIGEGEHIYLWVEKIGLNTAYLAEQLAKFCKLPLRNVTYAGRKDKYAKTQQWFSVHVPGKASFDWDLFDEPGAKVLHSKRHNKKLRTGVLKGNRFNLTIRQLSSTVGLEERLQLIAQHGVPNYYGSQRFGDTRYDTRGGNLVLAEKMIQGEPIKNRNKRSMAISALRSWLFNEMVNNRLKLDVLHKPMVGDVMQLAGSNSYFCTSELDTVIESRLAEQDIYLSAPLWGQGELTSQGEVLELENKLAIEHPEVTSTLASLGLKQERRAIQLFPKNMQWSITEDELNVEFSLPSGTFATSILREVLDTHQTMDIIPA
ncbi:tRNA pseudouridine(13) synthase TruD [Paraglaciecola sp. L3A3]|uniref:tRNA pseudouridine(13) synthase TruD n=1 Tax=Paraglaciecola sp. L3A3 TaxID=2686358 RepID=UPI00131CE0C2|nr:tRNA pseudouridine(13) synthase TruD [Paraglaciecola sp. L3A3]